MSIVVEVHDEDIPLKVGHLAGAKLVIPTELFLFYATFPQVLSEPSECFLAVDIIGQAVISFGDNLPGDFGELVAAGVIYTPSTKSQNAHVGLFCLDPPTFRDAFVSGDKPVLPSAGDWVVIDLYERIGSNGMTISQAAVSSVYDTREEFFAGTRLLVEHFTEVHTRNDPEYAHLKLTSVPRTDAKTPKPVKVNGGDDDVGNVDDGDDVVCGDDVVDGDDGDHSIEKGSSGPVGKSTVSTETGSANKRQKTQTTEALKALSVPVVPQTRKGRSATKANKVSGNGTPEKADETAATFVVRQPAKRPSRAAKPAATVKPPGKTPAKSTAKTLAIQPPVQATVIVAPVTAPAVSAVPVQQLKVSSKAAVVASTETKEEVHGDQDWNLNYMSNVGSTLLNFADRCNTNKRYFCFIYLSNCCVFICMLVL